MNPALDTNANDVAHAAAVDGDPLDLIIHGSVSSCERPARVTPRSGARPSDGRIAAGVQAGDVIVKFDGKSIDEMRRLLVHLTEDCCDGHPEICGGIAVSTTTPSACETETC